MENFPGIKTARVAKEMGGEQQVVNFIFNKNPNKQKISATFHCCFITSWIQGKSSSNWQSWWFYYF